MPAFICFAMLLFCSSAAFAEETIDSIAAIVNNDIITCYDVNHDTAETLQKLRLSGVKMLPSIAILNRRSLDDRITKSVQLQEAKRQKLHVDEEELNNALANIEARNKLMPGQLKEVIKQQGGDFNSFKENLRDQILISKLIDTEVRAKLQVSEESIAEYYRKYIASDKPRREVQLAEIFLAVPPEPTPEQLKEIRDKANMIHQQLLDGADFNRMVATYSESSDRDQQGVMGWFTQGGIAARFASALELPVNGITDIIRSPNGFHILKAIDERWKAPIRAGESYDEVHARHILLRIPSDADEATRDKIRRRAEGIAKDMKHADDAAFAARAKEVSQGPSAEKGGDLGWFRKGTMVPEFEQALFALQPGETSGVVQTQFGLHIIRMVARRHVDPNSLPANHDKIQKILSNMEMQEQLPRWIASLKAKADIEIRPCDSSTRIAASATPQFVGTSDRGDSEAALRAMLEGWGNAWVDRDVEAYLAYYSEHFQPGKRFRDLAAWRAQRRARLTSNTAINITLSHPKILITDPFHARIQFDQHYRSAQLDDHVHKMLLVEREVNGWKIVRELTEIPAAAAQ